MSGGRGLGSLWAGFPSWYGIFYEIFYDTVVVVMDIYLVSMIVVLVLQSEQAQ